MTRKRNVIQSQTVSQLRRNKYVFSLFLNTDSDEADVTFHTFAPALCSIRQFLVMEVRAILHHINFQTSTCSLWLRTTTKFL